MTKRRFAGAAVAALGIVCAGTLVFSQTPVPTSVAATRAVGNPSLGVLDSIVRDAIHDDQIPGAVLLVWHNGQVAYRKAFGNRALEPRREPMNAKRNLACVPAG